MPSWHRALESLARAGVYGGLCVPAVLIPGLYNEYAFAKMVFLHVIVAATFPAYAALAWRRPELRPRRTLVAMAALVWLGVLAVTTIAAEDPTRAFFGAADRMTGFFSLLHLFAWALMVLGLTTTWQRWLHLLRAHVVMGAAQACVGIVQVAAPTFLTLGVDGGPRVVGLAGNPIFFAAHQLFVFFVAAFLWRRRSTGSWGYTLAMLLSLAAMLASGSRGPLLGLLAGVFVAVLSCALMSGARKMAAWAAVAVVVGMVGYFVVAHLHLRLFQQHSALGHLFQIGDAGRVGYWTVALNAIPFHPVLGTGLDSFNIAYVLGYSPVNPCTPFHEDRAHNIVLETLTTTGVSGLLAWAFLWITLFRSVVRCAASVAHRASLLGLLVGHFVQSQFAFDTPCTWSPFLLVLALLAFLAPPSPAPPGGGSPPPAAAPALRMPMVAAAAVQALLIAITAAFTVRPAWVSAVGDRVNVARAQRDPAEAVSLLEHAARSSWPYDEEWLVASAVLVRHFADDGSLSHVPGAHHLVARTVRLGGDIVKRPAAAARLGPLYGRMLSDVAVATHDDALLADAERQLRANVALNPRRGNTVMDLADHLAASGRIDEAQGLYESLLRDAPDVGEIVRRAGIFFWRSRGDHARGAALTIHASQCPCLDEMGARATAQLSEAHALLGHNDEIKELAVRAERFARSDAKWGIAIAHHLESRHLLKERNRLLTVLIKTQPTLARYQSVVDGKLAHIEDADD